MSSSTENNEAEACRSPNCEFQQNLDNLRHISIFSSLPLESLKVLAYLAVRETYHAGDLLFHQGESDGQAFSILSGRATLLREHNGVETELNSYEAGDFLGGLCLLGEMRRLFSLRADIEVEALVLTREKFVKTVEQFPDVLPRIMEAVVDEVRKWEKRFFFEHAESCDACVRKVGVSLV
ncbi:Crp/Fnr family transcriptional regulator [Desulfohalovibrio reitneri]|uniref:Crp/Fnr family transcriptional regulator n=1 Tax=Desulfohalovibrio reitneri TaxID=1307759 RepID=UPI0004A72DF9|nr:cyclic nucleotide-binding domain-containing protein [Desulfohalovibrio reitneri]